MTTFAIVVGGGPAPGINGVIGAATILARRRGARVLGIEEGFNWLMRGDATHVRELQIDDVSRIHLLGGSVLGTSRANPTRDPADLARVVDTLQSLGVTHLVTIGGDDTCTSARRVSEAAGGRIQVAHVPKTIDNDLPLPPGIPTFGFETARSEATRLLAHLMEDARTSGRWYFAVLMGRTAGHLALGAASSAGVTATVVAEDFPEPPVRLDDLARMLEGTIVKRLAMGRKHGVAVLAEGIGEKLDPGTLDALPGLGRDEHGHLRLADLPLGRLVAERVMERLAEVGQRVSVVPKDIGYELRCAAPSAFDIAYTRELGAGAVMALLDGFSGVMITRQREDLVPVPFDEILDPETGRARVRLLDLDSESVRISRTLQIRLTSEDLAADELGPALTRTTGLDEAALRARYLDGLPAGPRTAG